MPPQGAVDQSGTYSRGIRLDCSGVPSISNTFLPGVGRQWFVNDGNSHNPQPEHSATARRSFPISVRHNYNDVDLSLHKDFPLTERFRLQFRSDFVNAFNHTQYNAPNMVMCHYGPDHQCSTA